MKFKVKNVEICARDPYSKKVYQYWIIGKLRSGRQIKIFDFERFGSELSDFKEKEVEYLIFAMVTDDKLTDFNYERFKGEFIKNIPPKFVNHWLNYENYLGPEYYSALKTEDGIFLIDRLNPNHHTTDYDGNLIVDIVRFDLFAWHPIAE